MRLGIEIADGAASQAWPEALPAELNANPAAQALLLLAAVAGKTGARAGLQYLRNSHVAVEIDP